MVNGDNEAKTLLGNWIYLVLVICYFVAAPVSGESHLAFTTDKWMSSYSLCCEEKSFGWSFLQPTSAIGFESNKKKKK